MNTTLVIFAIVAAFGLAAATLAVPIVPQAYAAAPIITKGPPACVSTGCSGDSHPGQSNHPGPL